MEDKGYFIEVCLYRLISVSSLSLVIRVVLFLVRGRGTPVQRKYQYVCCFQEDGRWGGQRALFLSLSAFFSIAFSSKESRCLVQAGVQWCDLRPLHPLPLGVQSILILNSIYYSILCI